MCCQPVPAATANPLEAAPKTDMGGGRGGLLVPLELWRAEQTQLSVVKGFLKDAAYRIRTRVWSDSMEWEQQGDHPFIH